MKRQATKRRSQHSDEDRRRDRPRGTEGAPTAAAIAQRQPEALDIASLKALQRSAGNEAVSSVLAQARPAVPVQRQRGTAAKKSSGSTTISPPTYGSYRITARTLAEAAEILNARGEAGETTWESPPYKVKTDRNGIVTSATVTVKVKVLMPAWPGAAKLSKPARAEWQRARNALARHERRHVALVKQHLKDLHKRLVGKTEADAAAEFEAALQELRDASDAYDAASDHGRNEGTELDTSIE